MQQSKVKYIPNMLTVLRMASCFLLVCLKPLSGAFLGVYLVCGLMDVLDGYLARKWQVTSGTGAFLDSIADFILVIVVMVKIVPVLVWEKWMLVAIAGIACIRGLTIVIGAVKYGTLTLLHTYSNKVTGGALFLFPLLIRHVEMDMMAGLLSILAAYSALEELLIIISSRQLDRNQKTLFSGKNKKSA